MKLNNLILVLFIAITAITTATSKEVKLKGSYYEIVHQESDTAIFNQPMTVIINKNKDVLIKSDDLKLKTKYTKIKQKRADKSMTGDTYLLENGLVLTIIYVDKIPQLILIMAANEEEVVQYEIYIYDLTKIK